MLEGVARSWLETEQRREVRHGLGVQPLRLETLARLIVQSDALSMVGELESRLERSHDIFGAVFAIVIIFENGQRRLTNLNLR